MGLTKKKMTGEKGKLGYQNVLIPNDRNPRVFIDSKSKNEK
jgi:hypothetical protein